MNTVRSVRAVIFSNVMYNYNLKNTGHAFLENMVVVLKQRRGAFEDL
jgi:hypothetical protein